MTRIDIKIPNPIDNKSEKVEKIFQHFDFNRDGGLNREEMAALVVAVNPRIKLSDAQINFIIDSAYKNYPKFIDGEKGITLDGLLRAYDDGAGDIDRDFDALGLNIDVRPATGGTEPRTKHRRAAFSDYGSRFQETLDIVDDLLDVLLKKLKLKEARNKNSGRFSDPGWSRELGKFIEVSNNRVVREESEWGRKYALLLKELSVFRSRANAAKSRVEAFDRHRVIGRVLYEHNLHREALVCFKIASAWQPKIDVRNHFYAGNCLYELGSYREARTEFLQALQAAAEAGGGEWDYLIPLIHVNLGIVLENEGMIFNACEHYRKAVILRPTHVRGFKRLGSALIVVGEYEAGISALQEAIFMKKDYVDALYDLASTLLIMGDEKMALLEFQRVLDLTPGDVDALFNLGGIYLRMGKYSRAYEVYGKVLVVWPNHWKAQLGKVVSLFGAGEIQKAKKSLKEALKTTKTSVELRDRIAFLKKLQNWRMQVKGSGIGVGSYVIVEPSKFKTAKKTTTTRRELACALDIRAFQKITKLHQCDVELIKNQLYEKTSDPDPVSSSAEISVRKVSVEVILRELLGFLKPETFVAAVKAINQKILCVLDESKSGRVDLDLFFAVIAPLCRGSPDSRKLVAYDALLWRPGNEGRTSIRITDAQRYIKLLRTIYMPSDGVVEMLEIKGGTDTSGVSLTDFLAVFDNPDWGFGIMSTLLNLETANRNGSYVCGTCRSPIIGSRFKEIKSHFSLCSYCYSDGKVPWTCKQEEYIFREFAN